MNKIASRTSIAAALCSLVACGNSAETDAQPTPTPVVGQAVEAAEPVPAQQFAEPSFVIRSEIPEVHVGAEATVRVTLDARGGFHLNADYPTHVTVTTPAALNVASAMVDKEHALSFAETSAVFPVRVTATTPGAQMLRAEVDFAVCTEQNCQPEVRTLLIPVNAVP